MFAEVRQRVMVCFGERFGCEFAGGCWMSLVVAVDAVVQVHCLFSILAGCGFSARAKTGTVRASPEAAIPHRAGDDGVSRRDTSNFAENTTGTIDDCSDRISSLRHRCH